MNTARNATPNTPAIRAAAPASHIKERAAGLFWRAVILAHIAQERAEAFAETRAGTIITAVLVFALYGAMLVSAFYGLAITEPRN